MRQLQQNIDISQRSALQQIPSSEAPISLNPTSSLQHQSVPPPSTLPAPMAPSLSTYSHNNDNSSLQSFYSTLEVLSPGSNLHTAKGSRADTLDSSGLDLRSDVHSSGSVALRPKLPGVEEGHSSSPGPVTQSASAVFPVQPGDSTADSFITSQSCADLKRPSPKFTPKPEIKNSSKLTDDPKISHSVQSISVPRPKSSSQTDGVSKSAANLTRGLGDSKSALPMPPAKPKHSMRLIMNGQGNSILDMFAEDLEDAREDQSNFYDGPPQAV